MPLISSVIPLFNKKPHIGRALHSVFAQTEPPGEIIVIDDGSTDGGSEVVKTFTDQRIKLINQANQGASSARNRGVHLARGELIAFLDADDVWKPRFLEEIMILRATYPQAGMYATAYDIFSPEGKTVTPDFDLLPSGSQRGLISDYLNAALKYMHRLSIVWSSAVVIPKNILKKCGGFPVGEFLAEDMDTWLRIGLHYPLAFSKESLAIYHQNAINRVFGWARFTNEPAVSRTARLAIDSGRFSEETNRELKEYAAHFQLVAARDFLLSGQRALGRQMLSYARGTRLNARNWQKWRLISLLPPGWPSFLWHYKQSLKKLKASRTIASQARNISVS